MIMAQQDSNIQLNHTPKNEVTMETRKMSQEDLNRLIHSGCPWRPKKLENVVIQELVSGDDIIPNNLEEGSFHPNGGSGCVVVDDDYICGIRCDHLIWMTGWHEHHGTQVSTDKYAKFPSDCLLLVGNHKGILIVSLVYEEH